MFSIKQRTCVLDLLQSPRGVLSYGGVLVQVFSASRQLEVDVSMADAVARQSDHNFHLYKYEPVTSKQLSSMSPESMFVPLVLILTCSGGVVDGVFSTNFSTSAPFSRPHRAMGNLLMQSERMAASSFKEL